MEIVELTASLRSASGKGGAKKCRNEGLLPGILYGKDADSVPVTVNPRELDNALNTHAGGNAIIKLSIDEQGREPVNVVVKELQVDPLRGIMRHVDFCQISLDRKIKSMVPFKMLGDSPGVKEGGILEHILWEMEIECLPLDIPDFIEVDVSELDMGDSVSIADIKVPDNISVLTDPENTIVTVAAPRVVEEEVEAAVEGELEEGEPEVISEGEKEAKEEKTEAEEAPKE